MRLFATNLFDHLQILLLKKHLYVDFKKLEIPVLIDCIYGRYLCKERSET